MSDGFKHFDKGFVRSSAAGQSLIWSLIAAAICTLQTRSGWFGRRCQTFAIVSCALMRDDVSAGTCWGSCCWSQQESSNPMNYLKSTSSFNGNAIKGFSEQTPEPFVEGHERQMWLCLSVRWCWDRSSESCSWLVVSAEHSNHRAALIGGESSYLLICVWDNDDKCDYSKAVVCSCVPEVPSASVSD